MSSLIDPITGLPYDALDTTLYSIPLNSQPYLAPEWNPQGRLNTSVYPDNGPSVFATGQAQNETNPETVQAMTTDGAGNLNVNVKKQSGGGGGGGSPVPVVCYQTDETTSGFGHEDVIDMGPIGSTIYGLTFAFTSDDVPGAGLTKHGAVYPFISSAGPSQDIVLATLAVNQVTTTTANRFAGEVTIWYGNGLIFPNALDPGNGLYRLKFQSTNIGGGHLIIAVWCSA